MTPSLKPGQRVQYTEDGILSCIYGNVVDWQFDSVNERIVYRVKWDNEKTTDRQLFPRSSLHRVQS